MIIVYESKTGFTKRYAEMLAQKINLKAFARKEVPKRLQYEVVLFIGWMKVGKVQGLKEVRNWNIIAVCGSGTGRTAEPDVETVIARNELENLPFFYMRGGCFPLKDLKGFDRFVMSRFVSLLKKREEKDDALIEAIDIIENGFDGVKEENLDSVLNWLHARGV